MQGKGSVCLEDVTNVIDRATSNNIYWCFVSIRDSYYVVI